MIDIVVINLRKGSQDSISQGLFKKEEQNSKGSKRIEELFYMYGLRGFNLCFF